MNQTALAQLLVPGPTAPAAPGPVQPLAPSPGRPFSNVFESWAPRKGPVAHLGPGASPVPAAVVSPELRRLVAAPEPGPAAQHPPQRGPRAGRSEADEAALAAWVSAFVPPPPLPAAQPLPAPRPLPAPQPDAPTAERSVAPPPPVEPAAPPVRAEREAPAAGPVPAREPRPQQHPRVRTPPPGVATPPEPAPAPSRADTVPSELPGLAGVTFTRPVPPAAAAADRPSAPAAKASQELAPPVVAGPPPIERPATDAPTTDPGQPPPDRQASPEARGSDEVSFAEGPAGESATEARPALARSEPLPSKGAAQAAPVPPPSPGEVEVVEARTELAPDLHVEVRAEGHRLEVVVHTTPALVSQYHDLGAELQASLQHGGFDLGGFSARGDRREPSMGPVANGQGPARPTRPRAARRGGRYA